jgi:L-fuconolactonase
MKIIPAPQARITRRQILSGAIAAGIGVSTNCVAPAAGSTPTIPTIDTHTHFYDPSRPQGVPWPARDDAFLYRRVLPADYRKLAEPMGVVGTVVVEASSWLEDNQWLLDLAKDDPFLVGIIGQLSPGMPEFAGQLGRFSENPLFRGIRIGSGKLDQQLDNAGFLDDLRRLESHGLALDINGGPEMLRHIQRLATKLPDLTIVVNHLANVRIDGKAPPREWRADLLGLKRCPRVWCKFSALVEGASRPETKSPTNVDYYRLVFETAFEAFGSSRLLYGSNWPVSERFGSYSDVHNLALKIASEQGDGFTRRLMFDNAQEAYGLARGNSAANPEN